MTDIDRLAREDDAEHHHEADAQRAPMLERVTRRAVLGGAGAGLSAALLAACGSSGAAHTVTETIAGSPAPTLFDNHRTLRFTVVSHATRSPVFTPTHYGVADACRLVGASYQWVGSQNGNIDELLHALNFAVGARVDGIATTLTDPGAFTAPLSAARDAGIPVIAYESDAPDSGRLAYIGSDPHASGLQMGTRIATLLPGGGNIAVFISAPGDTNLRARLQGLRQGLAGSGVHADVVATGEGAGAQQATINGYLPRHLDRHGFFALDGSSTSALANTIAGIGRAHVLAGGYDLTPETQQQLAAGALQFAIDEQPYLQGFLAILQLYLYRVSGGLTGPANVDTGARFVDRHGVAAYVRSQSRFEGTGSSPGLQPA